MNQSVRPLAKRVTQTPSSATVGIADTATEMRRNGISVLDFSAGRAGVEFSLVSQVTIVLVGLMLETGFRRISRRWFGDCFNFC